MVAKSGKLSVTTENIFPVIRQWLYEDKDIFVKVIFPATTPFILTAVRLGVSVALTTLIAAESTGASAGMGMRIRSFSNSFEVAPMLLYIILIGIIGITSEKIIKTLERKLTGWQEKREE